MTTHSITVRLPDALYRYLEQVARVTRRPLEQVVEQSIAGNLPPALADAPLELELDLADLQHMSPASLRSVMLAQVAPDDEVRHLELLERNGTGELTPAERDELGRLRQAADRLMLRKAYAAAVLRWLGAGEAAGAPETRR